MCDRICRDLDLDFGDGKFAEFCERCESTSPALCELCGEREGEIVIDPRGDGVGVLRCASCVDPLRDLTIPVERCVLCNAPAPRGLCATCRAALRDADTHRDPGGLGGEFHPSLFADRRF